VAKLDEELFLGELILCYDDIKEYAQKEELDLEKEFAKVVSHGILHLLGFEHGEKMFAIEQSVADKFIKFTPLNNFA
jgi:rRNA maturation RNase YbeY